MSTIFQPLIRALLKERSSIEDVQRTLDGVAASIESRHNVIEARKKEVKKDAKRGARLSNHRFSL